MGTVLNSTSLDYGCEIESEVKPLSGGRAHEQTGGVFNFSDFPRLLPFLERDEQSFPESRTFFGGAERGAAGNGKWF